jgi:hypothetical protein
MTKKGPLSKAEKFYIENHRDLELTELCKDLDRAQGTINKFVATLPKANTVQTQVESKKETNLSKQFARNEKGGAVVMTPNASIMADEKRPDFSSKKTRSKRCVTSIKD